MTNSGRTVRALSIAVTVLLVLAVLADPYTLRASGSDSIVLAPWWQLLLGLADVALLLVVGLLLFRRAYRPANVVARLELPFAIAACLILILRDGRVRFITGLGAQDFASLYFATLLLRVLLIELTRRLSTPTAVTAPSGA